MFGVAAIIQNKREILPDIPVIPTGIQLIETGLPSIPTNILANYLVTPTSIQLQEV